MKEGGESDNAGAQSGADLTPLPPDSMASGAPNEENGEAGEGGEDGEIVAKTPS